MEHAHKKLYCQVVATLIIADAAITDAERSFLERLMDRFGFSKEERAAVINSVNIGDDVQEKVMALPTGVRAELLQELEAVAAVDEHIDAREARIIETVRAALA